MSQKLLTPDEVAERLSVKPTTVRKWLREGTLQGIKTGRIWRVEENSLNKFIINRQLGSSFSGEVVKEVKAKIAADPLISTKEFANFIDKVIDEVIQKKLSGIPEEEIQELKRRIL